MPSQNTAALLRYLDRLADVEPAPVRVKEKVFALAALCLAMAWLDGGNLAAQIVEERHQQIVGCAAQYGAGERWARTNPQQCVPMVEAPAYVMTMPVGQ